MTIKEVEILLDIPRATIRFYEKEGLVEPIREENGYRAYSEEDVEKLKKIIILRKIGVSVEDIADLFDGAKSMHEVLDLNLMNLQKQMEELKGAISLSQKMQEDHVEISMMNTDLYWNTIEEEEKRGNSFIDIAKDIAGVEKDIVKNYFSFTRKKGKNDDSLPVFIRNVLISIVLVGCLKCLLDGSWSVKNFLYGIVGIGSIMIVEMVISVPMYFLGKKYEWIRNNRHFALIIITSILLLILFVIYKIWG